MGAHANPGTHQTFARRNLNEAGKAKFAKHDDLASVAMSAFDELPQSREASLAKTNLEQAIFWANRAVVMSPEFSE